MNRHIITPHLRKWMRERFNQEIETFIYMNEDKALKLLKWDKKYPGLGGNFHTHPHQFFYVFEDSNLGIACDPNTNKLCTALYLDGTDGYTGQSRYDRKLDELVNKYNK